MRLVPLNITLIVIPECNHIVAWSKRNARSGVGRWENATRAGSHVQGLASPLLPLPPTTPFNFNHDGLLLHAVIRPIVLQLSSPLSSLGTWDLIFANEVVQHSRYTRWMMARNRNRSENSAPVFGESQAVSVSVNLKYACQMHNAFIL
jgi:hypothetical protein